jgi:flagellar FliL protein
MENTMQKIVFSLLLLMLAPALLAADDETVAGASPGYIPLGKPMILNLATKGNRLTFLQVTGDVLIKDESNKEEVEIHVPAIRHELILLLSEQDADDMKSPVKREEVRKQATQQVKARIEQLVGSDEVAEVLFSTFLVQ